MTIPSSGPLAASIIRDEFNGTNPFRFSDYFAGGPFVPAGTIGDNGPIPTSGELKFSDFYGSSNIAVDVQGGTFFDISFGAPAGVGYQLNSSGAEQSYDDNSGNFVTFNTWLITLTPADYECRLTLIEGDVPDGSAVNAWLPLSVTRNWTFAQVIDGVLDNTCLIEIRHVPSLDVIDSADVSMHAENTTI